MINDVYSEYFTGVIEGLHVVYAFKTSDPQQMLTEPETPDFSMGLSHRRSLVLLILMEP